ncbi:MAG: adenylate kinase [Clostridia bacterium]|nr:adenylate kinase [Clostridia bacterium]
MNIIFLGPPGAGKGTQAQKICDALNSPQISTGDILRRAMKEGTETGKKAKSYIDAGQLVPDEVIIDIVKERLVMDDCRNGYILDGFPRTVPQAEALDTFATINSVIELDVKDEELVNRLSGRRVCLKCGATYHISMLGGKTTCDKCGEELIQRNDDKAETVLNRLKVYHDQTAPLIGYYEQKGLLKKIDGAQGMEKTTQAILEALGAKA